MLGEGGPSVCGVAGWEWDLGETNKGKKLQRFFFRSTWAVGCIYSSEAAWPLGSGTEVRQSVPGLAGRRLA